MLSPIDFFVFTKKVCFYTFKKVGLYTSHILLLGDK
jgi:hypothetical protein